MTTRNRLLRGLLAIGLIASLAAACSDEDPEVEAGGPGTSDDDSGDSDISQLAPPDKDASTSGSITTVSVFEPVTEDCTDPDDLDPDDAVSSDDPPICTDPDSTILGSVLVEATPGVQEGDKYSLTIDESTVLLQQVGDAYERVDFDELAEGQAVDVWIDGAIAESYPAQATASTLVITG